MKTAHRLFLRDPLRDLRGRPADQSPALDAPRARAVMPAICGHACGALTKVVRGAL